MQNVCIDILVMSYIKDFLLKPNQQYTCDTAVEIFAKTLSM